MERRLREDWVSVLELEGKPCGYVSWALDEDDGGLWLHNLFVLPEYQSRGIGGWALGRMVAVARESGEVLQLRCLKHNERALAFYDRDGLRRTGESETHVYFEG